MENRPNAEEEADAHFELPAGEARARLRAHPGRGPEGIRPRICLWWATVRTVPKPHRLARELGIERHVTFLGKQDHVERLFPQHARAADAERNGVVWFGALEAMACGVPPVATRVGGCAGAGDRRRGRVPGAGGRHRGQAARVVELLTDEKLHEKMAEAARRTAVERFASRKIIPQYEQYYQQVVGGEVRCPRNFLAPTGVSKPVTAPGV